MRSRIRLSILTTLATTAALTVALPATASASISGLEFVTGTTSFDSTVYKAVTVTCPSGKQVIGTGYQFFGAPGSVVLDDLIPTATTLRVGAGEVVGPGEPADGTTQSWRIEATALCANPLPGLQVGSQTSEFDYGGSRQVGASCPFGKKLVGAGASLSQGFGQISIDSLLVSDTNAFASGREDDDFYSGQWSVTVYTICADPIPGLQTNVTTTFSDSNTSKSGTATCPGGTRALGTGWSNTGTGEVYITGVSTQSNGVTVNANEDANGYNANWDLTMYTICANP